jgi:hypothetical protein
MARPDDDETATASVLVVARDGVRACADVLLRACHHRRGSSSAPHRVTGAASHGRAKRPSRRRSDPRGT